MQAKLRHDGVTLSSICCLYGCFYKHLSSLTLKTNRFVTRSIGNIVNWTNGCFQMLVDCGNLPVTQVKEKHVDEWKHINCSLICRDLCFLPVCVRKNWLFLSLLIMRFILFSVKYKLEDRQHGQTLTAGVIHWWGQTTIMSVHHIWILNCSCYMDGFQ